MLATHYNFGQIKLLNTAPIEHTFVLQNEGKDAVVLDRLQPSCGCTSAVIGNGTVSPKGLAIAPGQRLSIHTSVDPQRLSPGPIDKFVSVFVQGQATPAATLEITGTLEGGVTFSQSALDFRTIRADSKAGLPLTVTLDVPLLPASVKPHLVSSNPDVVLEQQPNQGQQPSLTGKTVAAETLVQSYLVRLASHPKLGILTGIISVVGGDPANLKLLSPVTVSIQGEVTGDVAASPSACAFGMVTQGYGQVQRLQLTAATRADLQKLKVTSSSRFLSLRLVATPNQKATGSSRTARTLLEVKLDPKTPIGVLQAQIAVKTPAGEQLILPVYAYVVHAQHTQ